MRAVIPGQRGGHRRMGDDGKRAKMEKNMENQRKESRKAGRRQQSQFRYVLC